MDSHTEKLIKQALVFDKWAIGQLVSIFEDKRLKNENISQKAQILTELALAQSYDKKSQKAKCIGFTGSPGVGKSSLINRLVQELLSKQKKVHIAVLAVDPSSPVSGGAFLGDRGRTCSTGSVEDKNRLFFRSQATDLDLGGLCRTTFSVSRLLHYLFDLVLIETVGIGQNETEIQYLADTIVLLLQPESGDQMQFFKAGVMEIPDIFVINKCDQTKAAKQSLSTLTSSLLLVRPNEELPVVLTSAQSGQGIAELSTLLLQKEPKSKTKPVIKPITREDREDYHFRKWISEEFGRQGLEKLAAHGNNPRVFIDEVGGSSSYESAQLRFMQEI